MGETTEVRALDASPVEPANERSTRGAFPVHPGPTLER
jgi:hypothetical protein